MTLRGIFPLFLILLVQSVSAQRTDPRQLSALSDALLDDVKLGDIQAAILHHEQIGMAVSPLEDDSDAAAAIGQKWRDLFNHSLNSLSQKPWIPDDEKLTNILLTDALQVRGATHAGDWELARSTLEHMSERLLPYEASAPPPPGDPWTEDTAAPIREEKYWMHCRELSKKFSAAAMANNRSSQVLEAELLAPLMLLETKRMKQPSYCTAAYGALSRGSLARGDYETAGYYLLASVGSECQDSYRILNSELATALVCKGYDDKVLDYLTRFKAFRKEPADPELYISQIIARCR